MDLYGIPYRLQATDMVDEQTIAAAIAATSFAQWGKAPVAVAIPRARRPSSGLPERIGDIPVWQNGADPEAILVYFSQAKKAA